MALIMPGTDGYEVCRRPRGRPDLGIVMLTAMDEVKDRVLDLRLSRQPFEFEELLSGIWATPRRLNWAVLETLVARPLTLDGARHQVTI